MKRYLLAAAAVTVLTSPISEDALAQCAFDGPAKAKSIKTSLIRTHSGCPNISGIFPDDYPNSSTGTGVPSCAPPYAFSPYRFGDKGACTFQMTAKLETPCAGGVQDSCMAFGFKAECKDVRSPDDTPTNDPGFALRMVIRATIDDEDNGDMTVIDFPSEVPFPVTENGSFSVTEKAQTMLPEPLPPLPGCSQLELLAIAIVDPEGNSFAVLGSGTRPK